MYENQIGKKKLAIVRGIGARYYEAQFYSRFKDFEVNFISNKPKSEFGKVSGSARFRQLKLKPAYLFDPMRFLGNKSTQRSWLKLDNLEASLEKFDVIDTYETFHFFSAQCAESARKNDKPLVTNIWMNIPNHPVKFVLPYSFNVRKVIDNSTLFILRTQKSAYYLRSLGVSESKMELVYMGLDLSKFEIASQDTEKVRILFVGELVESKGIDDLLRVFSRLVGKYLNLELWVVGKGKLVNHVVASSKELPVKYLGYLPAFELPKIYQKCQIFCLPSKTIKYVGIKWVEEMFGYVFVEAMASGLPIVSTYCGAIPEVVGDNNMLVNQGDEDGLFKALSLLVSDQVERAKIGIANRNRTEDKFNLEKQVLKQGKLLNSIV